MMLAELNRRFVTLIETAHPEFRDVARHRGRMSDEDVKKAGVFSPAARVGLFGRLSTEREPSGILCLRVPFAIALITSEADVLDSQDRAIALALSVQETISAFIPGAANADHGWQVMPGVGLPEDIEIDVSDSDWLDNEGIAIWAVLFKIAVEIGEDFAAFEAGQLADVVFPPGSDPEELLP